MEEQNTLNISDDDRIRYLRNEVDSKSKHLLIARIIIAVLIVIIIAVYFNMKEKAEWRYLDGFDKGRIDTMEKYNIPPEN